MRFMIKTAGVALVAAIGLSGGFAQANPVPMNATLAGSTSGTNYCGNGSGSILATTSCVTFDATNISELPPTYTPFGGVSAPNTFLSLNVLTLGSASTIVTPLSVAGFPTGVALPDPISNFLTFAGSTGTYKFSTSDMEIVTRDATNGILGIEMLGLLTDTSGNYSATSAGLIMTINQSSNTGSVSGSYTLGSPPAFNPPQIPEPASLTLLGAGLIGLGAIRRRRHA